MGSFALTSNKGKGAFQFRGNAKLTSKQANFSAKNCHFDESSRRNPAQMAGTRTGFLGGPRNDTGFTSYSVKDYVKLAEFAPKLKYTPLKADVAQFFEPPLAKLFMG